MEIVATKHMLAIAKGKQPLETHEYNISGHSNLDANFKDLLVNLNNQVQFSPIISKLPYKYMTPSPNQYFNLVTFPILLTTEIVTSEDSKFVDATNEVE